MTYSYSQFEGNLRNYIRHNEFPAHRCGRCNSAGLPEIATRARARAIHRCALALPWHAGRIDRSAINHVEQNGSMRDRVGKS